MPVSMATSSNIPNGNQSKLALLYFMSLEV
jgi:hypothetical protein